jgi:hypothetical protein
LRRIPPRRSIRDSHTRDRSNFEVAAVLVIATKELIASPENVAPKVSLKEKDQFHDSIWFDHPSQIGGTLKDGTRVSLTLTTSETAELYLQLHNSERIRHRAEWIEFRKTKAASTGQEQEL